ncbi:histidinol dehydrogenase [Bryobacter aggregatus]|uniref:histidinol dehydrogenase n=1 Tax=Bryobacter aggregatus TaxID=360054 RepID=UPI0004E27D0A|nr:histidinol dehydrogenase [Bryobacter aggregatus]
MPLLRILPRTKAASLLKRRQVQLDDAIAVVRPILEAVRKNGDKALLQYARKFDNFDRKSPRVTPQECAEAAKSLSPAFVKAVKVAAANIRNFAKLQIPKPANIEIAPGLNAGYIVRPLDTVAAYIPSGRYPLPSTLLMTTQPAQVAGVPNICVTSPRFVPEIFGTAHLLGVEQTYLLGGAHAIAAFAYGTKTVPKADRIVGPGNIYVAAAKKLLAGEVGIDFVAGPTEILIIAATGNPKWIAADMLAQAEHDTDAAAILLTTSAKLAEAVAAAVELQLKTLPTAAVAKQALRRNSAILMVDSLEEACELSNQFAPEHLSIPSASLLKHLKHAGGIFIGGNSPEAAGDYASGPNHVLPTSGAARLRGGLSAADYVKVITTQQLTPEALAKLAPTITTLARAEGLEAHARSIEARLD